MTHAPKRFPSLTSFGWLTALCCVGSAACAMDLGTDHDIRIVPQALFGTAGFEPGLALEWREVSLHPLIFRPEIFINEDERLGAGGSVLFDVTTSLSLPNHHALAIGPRVVYHHADDHGLEADVMATWGYALSSAVRPWRHALGALAALGVVHDREHDDNDLGATVGGFYSFRF